MFYNLNQKVLLSVILSFLLLQIPIIVGQTTDSLYSNFINPPNSAKPRTWWHWTKGNISKEGIKKDLEWMKKVGIAGFQLSDVNFGGGQLVNNKTMFGSDEWYDAVKFAADEAERLDLEMAIFSSPGWSITGGPWVKPEQAMKKVVWSDTLIKGGKYFEGRIAKPPTNYGPFKDLSFSKNKDISDENFYKDIGIYGQRVSDREWNFVNSKVKITFSGDTLNIANLFDENLNSTAIVFPDPNKDTAWIKFNYDELVSISSFTISAVKGIPVGRLLASNDGINYSSIVELPGAQLYRQGWNRTFTFPKIITKNIKIEFFGKALNPAETMNQPNIIPAEEYALREIKLYAQPKINRWEEKAGFRHLFEYESVTRINNVEEELKSESEFINLTNYFDETGILKWNVPDGNWKILRMGYSLTGVTNRPAVPSGLGLEVDKLSSTFTEYYIKEYLAPFKENLNQLLGKRLSHVLIDSWEAGMQNWTDNMIEEFKIRRGYDPTPYLPTLAGYIVQNADISDRFLWDFRRTIADMFAENHYGTITKYLKQFGIQTYAEASGVSLEILEDALLCKKFVDIPMGEFWMKDLHPSQMYFEDIRGAASSSNIYGKKITAAEAFTGGGYESPFKLKKVADYWFCQGVNQLVFHTSAHQPKDTKPGNVMVGTHLHRNITWADNAKQFIDYLSRVSSLLQHGNHVADVAYLLNEGAPSTMPIWGDGLTPKIPEGYDFDYINSDVLLNNSKVTENGNLTLPNGIEYKLLVLPKTNKMTINVIKKIYELIKNGATVVGEKPLSCPNLFDYPKCEVELKNYVSQVWGDLDGISRNKRSFGKGKVFWGLSLDKILDDLKIKKDLEYSKPLDMSLNWIHRRTRNEDIYFVVNDSKKKQNIDLRFRVSGKIPQIWFPDNGEKRNIKYEDDGELTTLNYKMHEYESGFIVFSKEKEEEVLFVSEENDKNLDTLKENWLLTFPNNLNDNNSIKMDTLKYWSDFDDQKIKYFSGTAFYKTSFYFNQDEITDKNNIYLNLGKVNDIVKIYLNEIEIGTLWKSPYEIDISDYLKYDKNEIRIEVTNQWTNRIIGDLNLEDYEKTLSYEKGAIYFFGPPPELPQSGLIGPVRLIQKLN